MNSKYVQQFKKGSLEMILLCLEDGKITKVTGNTCPRGEKYAHQELTDPQRMLTSTVRIEGDRKSVV